MEDKRQDKCKIQNNQQVQRKSEKDKNGVVGGIVFGIILTIVGWIVYRYLFQLLAGKIILTVIGSFGFLCYAVAISCFIDYKESRKIEKMEEDAQAEEKEFSEIDPSKRELRAEKLFRMNQKELMRYYDVNLGQTKFLSGLGIVMIIAGVLVVAVTIYLYSSKELDRAILFVGGLSGVVFDFIGAIFIKMYTGNVEAAVKFHAKLAESNNLLLSNSIANKIDDKKLREETLSDISKSIVLRKNIVE